MAAGAASGVAPAGPGGAAAGGCCGAAGARIGPGCCGAVPPSGLPVCASGARTVPAVGPFAPAGDYPPPAGEAVAVIATGDAHVLDGLAELRRRGADARAWVVGEAVVEEPGVTTRRVGLEWPLPG